MQASPTRSASRTTRAAAASDVESNPPATPTTAMNSLTFRDMVTGNSSDSEMRDLSERSDHQQPQQTILLSAPGQSSAKLGHQRRSRGSSLSEINNRSSSSGGGLLSAVASPSPSCTSGGVVVVGVGCDDSGGTPHHLDSGNHSSEEELEEINMAKDYRPGPEKRKWCDLSHSEASSESEFELHEIGRGTVNTTSDGNTFTSAIEAGSRSASVTSADTSCDTPSGDEDQNHNKVLPTPLEFSTSPPTHVYKPKKSHNFSEGGGTCDNSSPGEDGSTTASAFTHHEDIQQQLQDVNCLREEKTEAGSSKAKPRNSQNNINTRFSSSLDDLRHLHGSKKYLSPRKKTRRIQLIQRPCLDFEKMQQLRSPAVTDWRPAGELSLFCW